MVSNDAVSSLAGVTGSIVAATSSLENVVVEAFRMAGLLVKVSADEGEQAVQSVIAHGMGIELEDYATSFTVEKGEVRWGRPTYFDHDKATGHEVDRVVAIWARTSRALEEVARVLNKGAVTVGDGCYDDCKPMTSAQRGFLLVAGYVPGGVNPSLIEGYWTEVLTKRIFDASAASTNSGMEQYRAFQPPNSKSA